MQPVPRCLVCDEAERTLVAEYNRLIFNDDMWRSDLARFEYALCHGCGLVYATRHPDREEYEFLYARFNEFLTREGNPNSYSVPELTDELRKQIDASFVPWSDLASVERSAPHVRRRLRRELANVLRYLPHIVQHVPLAGAKVLHLRAKSSTLGDYLRKVHGAAQVDVVTLFPAHQYLAEKNEGIRAVTCLDYQQFHIPFEDKYDLIIDNHVLIHMMDPNQVFAEFAAHLNPGGALFLQAELSDDVLFRKRKNLFTELRPFHFQQFDKPVLERMLRRFGYESVGVEQPGGVDPELFGVARWTHPPGPAPRIGADELRARLAMYHAWRDESILWLPKERAHALFGGELDQVLQRVRRAGRGNIRRSFREANLPLEALDIGPAGAAHGPLGGLFHWMKSVFWKTPLKKWLTPGSDRLDKARLKAQAQAGAKAKAAADKAAAKAAAKVVKQERKIARERKAERKRAAAARKRKRKSA
jgi:SAM-dependent methyltransferase